MRQLKLREVSPFCKDTTNRKQECLKVAPPELCHPWVGHLTHLIPQAITLPSFLRITSHPHLDYSTAFCLLQSFSPTGRQGHSVCSPPWHAQCLGRCLYSRVLLSRNSRPAVGSSGLKYRQAPLMPSLAVSCSSLQRFSKQM